MHHNTHLAYNSLLRFCHCIYRPRCSTFFVPSLASKEYVKAFEEPSLQAFLQSVGLAQQRAGLQLLIAEYAAGGITDITLRDFVEKEGALW